MRKYVLWLVVIIISLAVICYFYRGTVYSRYVGLEDVFAEDEERRRKRMALLASAEEIIAEEEPEVLDDVPFVSRDIPVVNTAPAPTGERLKEATPEEQVYYFTPRPSRIMEMMGSYADIRRAWKGITKKQTLGEFICQRTLETIFQRPFPTCYPHFLREAGRLQLDGYCEYLQLAFEFQGSQHNERENPFHHSDEAWEKQLRNDRKKRIACYNYGVTLLLIYQTNVDYPSIPIYIANLLPPEYDPYRYDLII